MLIKFILDAANQINAMHGYGYTELVLKFS